MKPFLRPITGLMLLIVMAAAGASEAKNDFSQLLEESGLEFSVPEGFKAIPVEPDYVMPYQAHYLSADGNLEIRYAIRPLDRMEIDYKDPHNAAPAPNDLFNMLFRSLSETLSVDHQVISRDYTTGMANKEYRAGWASAGVFDISPDVSKSFRQGMLIAIHQNDKADAYTFFLTNDLAANKERIKKVRGNLRFKSLDKGINQPPSVEELKNLPLIPE